LSSESSASAGAGFLGFAREEADGDGDGGALRGSGDERRRCGGAAAGGELSLVARPGMAMAGGVWWSSVLGRSQLVAGASVGDDGSSIPFGEGQEEGGVSARCRCLLARED